MSTSPSPSRRVEPRDIGRRYSAYEYPSSYREVRYLSVPSGPAEIAGRSSSASRQGSRNSSRRSSTVELSQAISRTRSLSPYRKPIGSDSKFRYSPLDSKVKRAIRVIRIRPDLQDGYILCDIEHTTPSSSYSALSYTWGSPDTLELILIDGHPFTVRQNLYAFLRHARRYHAGKALWIDAICINQEDIQEKNRQVKIMSKIYSETREVLVWLGPHVDYVGHAIRRMHAYEEMGDTEMALSSSKDDDFWKGFKAINNAIYWDRVWVIQEFIQPKTGRIIQGDRWVSFETFQDTIRRFNNKIYRLVLKHWVFGPRRNEDFSDYISNIHPLWQRRLERAKSSSKDPIADANWALLSGSRYCQDIRDRVYGIMSLATHGNSLSVDYHLNPFEVLLESLWLEYDSDMDRTDVLMNLANILMLTPASICMYAQKRTSKADRHLRKSNLPRDRDDAEEIHLRAASSRKRQEEWLDVVGGGRGIVWRNFAAQRLKVPKGSLEFPSRRQCPWHMFVCTSTRNSHIGLKLAVDSRSVPDERGRIDDREYRGSDAMSKEDFLAVNSKQSLALGVYRTTCAPFPLVIYYALSDKLEGTQGGDNKAGALGEALDGLNDFDFDLDF